MRKTIFTFLILALSVTALGQTNTQRFCSGDPLNYVKEVEKYLDFVSYGGRNDLIKKIEKTWNSDFYTDHQKGRIIEITNNLIEGKVRTTPDFVNFLNVVNLYPNMGADVDYFNNWFEIIEGYSIAPIVKKPLTQFLQFSQGFLESKSLYKTQSGSVDWRVEEYNFRMESTLESVKLIFDETSLSCLSKGSQIQIGNTSGVFDVFENKWQGKGGKVVFSEETDTKGEVWVDVFGYMVEMQHSYYNADSVVYHNRRFLKEPLLGTLTDKVTAENASNESSYPRFQSYNVRIPMQNLAKGVDYVGGFAQNGQKIIGTGTVDNPAVMNFYREGRVFVRVSSQRFLMSIAEKDEEVEEESRSNKNRIVSSDARVVIYLDGDSILHPGLKFNFYTDDRLVTLVRVRGEMSETPYTNSFHNLEMRFELMNWRLDYPIIEFTSYDMNTDKGAVFESNDFFREDKYDNLMMASSWHPLVRMKRCATIHDTNVISLSDITECLKIPVTGVEPMLLRYKVMGYLDYNEDSKEVTLYPKLFHQVNSKSGREDYDVIQIYSDGARSATRKNATINLLNNDMTINGISSINLSTRHKVKILPDSGTIVMHRDRDFDFNGVISSGKVDFYGRDFKFKYEDFFIDMPVIDSMQMWASTEERDRQGFLLETRVRTVIENLKGDMKIDHPENKSGKEDIPEYPIFRSKDKSYAFYDKKSTFNGIYDRNEFYFELVPFEIDSLDKFTNKGIRFDGTFVSAGILPDIPQTLGLQEDYSLGFRINTPPGGYPLYGGKGNFQNELHLSDKGLKGDGFIKYITSTAQSKEFYFFPKEVQGVTHLIEIEEQMASVEYPNVFGDTTKVRWIPYDDEYFISTLPGKSPITMFGGTAIHTGKLKYTPSLLSGSGTSKFEGAILSSDSMVYSFFKIHADTANFELGRKTLETIDFYSENVKADIDFNARTGMFVSNTGASLTKFDLVKYQAYLDRFKWFMDKEEIEITSSGMVSDQGASQQKLAGAEFVSIHPQQDSLRFNTLTARYNLAEIKLEALEVKFINVADAEVIPNKGLVVVHENAQMDRLDSSIIVANREFRYHKIYDASTQIFGRWKYKSYGKYDYIDENNMAQVIELTEVKVDTSRQTTASGIITEEEDFSLSPMYRYKGKVNLQASRKNLDFKGFGKIVHECTEVGPVWFSFGGEVDPKNIAIVVDENIHNLDDRTLYGSLIMPRDSSLLYGAFLNQLHHSRDVPVSWATGFLKFDAGSREFRISNLEKLNERSNPGNYVALNTKTCEMKGEGKLQLVQKTGYVDVSSVGTYSFNTIDRKSDFKTSFGVNFLFDEALLQMIVDDIQKEELNGFDIDNAIYELTLRETLGKEAADDMISKMSLGKTVKVPEEFRKTLFFSEVQFKWNENTQSYISKGKLKLANMGKSALNVEIEGAIELIQSRGATDINILLQVNNGKWYMFNYKASTGYMKVYSTNPELHTKINEVKTDKRRIKGDKDHRQYQYIVGTKRMKTDFDLRIEEAK